MDASANIGHKYESGHQRAFEINGHDETRQANVLCRPNRSARHSRAAVGCERGTAVLNYAAQHLVGRVCSFGQQVSPVKDNDLIGTTETGSVPRAISPNRAFLR